MDLERIHDSRDAKTRSQTNSSQQGFALVSLIALIPLVATVSVSLASAFYAMKKKALAQAHCVQEAARMQNRLKEVLERLLKLNRDAERLRATRLQADRALASALASANPYAIAAAKAFQTAVILQQTTLRARQENLLAEAASERRRGVRELYGRLRPLRVGVVDSRTYYWRPLAVEARPAHSLTPNFEPVPSFSTFQQHRFRFQVNLEPPFAVAAVIPGLKQTAGCSVSLFGKEKKWQVRILTANPV